MNILTRLFHQNTRHLRSFVTNTKKQSKFDMVRVTKHPPRSKFALSTTETTESLRKELKCFSTFMTHKFFKQQEARVLPVTAQKVETVVKQWLGWMHRQQDHSLESLCLNTLIPTKEKDGVVPTYDYLTWLVDERNVTPGWESCVCAAAIQLAKFLYHKESTIDPSDGGKPYSDIPVINELRKLSKDSRKRSKVASPPADESLKWLDWSQYLDVCRVLKQEAIITKEQSGKLKDQAWALQKMLMFNILASCPDRQRTIRDLQFNKTLFKENEQWVIKHTEHDYKTGKAYGARPPLVISAHIYRDLEEYLFTLRAELQPQHSFVFTQKNGKPLTAQSFHKLFTRAVWRLTGKKMNPHLVRDSIVTHLRRGVDGAEDASEKELESLAMYMGHSLATQRDSYDRRTKSQKVEPAIGLLNRVNSSLQ